MQIFRICMRPTVCTTPEAIVDPDALKCLMEDWSSYSICIARLLHVTRAAREAHEA